MTCCDWCIIEMVLVINQGVSDVFPMDELVDNLGMRSFTKEAFNWILHNGITLKSYYKKDQTDVSNFNLNLLCVSYFLLFYCIQDCPFVMLRDYFRLSTLNDGNGLILIFCKTLSYFNVSGNISYYRYC